MNGAVLDRLPMGVMVIGGDLVIRYWNRWLADHTGITPNRAHGCNFQELFPDARKPRFLWAIEQVCTARSPQVLSQSLNRYLVPIPIRHANRHGLTMMQQHVHIEPLTEDGETVAVVSISDVTENVIRSSALMEMAQKLQQDSNRDPLTGLFNRRFMWEWLVQQFRQSVRAHYPISCLMLDVDHFKQINDSHGHDVGDQVLRDIAVIMTAKLRQADIVVRYGGEEFVALLPDCKQELALQVASRIHEEIGTTVIGDLVPGTVTCSIGIALYDPLSPCTGEELLKMADRRLYQAKNGGRNRIVPAMPAA